MLCRAQGRPTILGIAGPQGSGKSTLGRILAKSHGGVCLSLDDVYKTRFERQEMGRSQHPLFVTRGPPATHDLDLLDTILSALMGADADTITPLPAFDKLTDERCARKDWPIFKGRPSLIVVEGWCLGCLPQFASDLKWPVNRFEREEDADGRWRRTVNQALLEGSYGRLRTRLDGLVYLRPPSFDIVADWRSQQEAQLLDVAKISEQRHQEIIHFIAHFERLSRWMMTGGVQADLTIQLDESRRVVSLS